MKGERYDLRRMSHFQVFGQVHRGLESWNTRSHKGPLLVNTLTNTWTAKCLEKLKMKGYRKTRQGDNEAACRVGLCSPHFRLVCPFELSCFKDDDVVCG